MLVKNLQTFRGNDLIAAAAQPDLTEFIRPILAALLRASALVVQGSKVAKQEPPGRVT